MEIKTTRKTHSKNKHRTTILMEIKLAILRILPEDKSNNIGYMHKNQKDYINLFSARYTTLHSPINYNSYAANPIPILPILNQILKEI